MLKRTLSESSRQQMKALIKPDKMRLCPSGFFMWKDSCYHITAGEVSWFEGKTYCEGKGATLTSIHNNDTTAFLQRLYDKNVPNPSLFGYWVGATDEVTEDNWAWLDGTKFDYVVWSESWLPYTQPSGGRTENCLAVATDSEYHDYPCEKKLPAICHRPTKFHKVGS